MPIVVNSNTTATVASFNLSRANDALRTSLARLSSGKRIVNPADDAGGLSVANKLASKLDRTEAVRQNVQSGISYLQVQDGALSTVAKVVDRMAELRTMASDVTKNSQDIENYSKEFIELQKQLNQMYHEKFNGISLFSMSRTQAITNPPDLRPTLDKNNSVLDASNRVYQTFSRNILTTADGVKQDGNISLNTVNLQYMLSIGGLDTTYLSATASAIITAQRSNNQQVNNDDLKGERSFINIGNVNGANTNDWTDHTDALNQQIIGKMSAVGRNAKNWTLGGISTGDIINNPNASGAGLTDFGATFTAGANMKGTWSDGVYAANSVVYHTATQKYYSTAAGAVAGEVPGAGGDWAIMDASGNGTGDTFEDIVGELTAAATFATQAEVDTYMDAEVYTQDNFLQSIMFVSMGTFTDLIERVADARAENGAEQNRLRMTSELLTQNQTNLEAAHGRIMDADIALESTRFARQNVLVQSSAAMVAQANQLTNIALTILG